MPNPVLLNNVDHKDLRIITRRGAQYGDEVSHVPTFPFEFRNLEAHYPIVFRKSGDGTTFEPIALFGFQEGENLFLDGDRWDATYVPLMIERQPFLIGVGNGEMMVNIDADSPRVSKTEGEELFKPHGGTTEFLDRMNSVLFSIHQGFENNKHFVPALLKYDLLESFVLDVELDDGSQGRMSGFYTINEEKLNALGAAALEELHKPGYLQAIYMVLASLSRFRNLIDRKNKRQAAGV